MNGLNFLHHNRNPKNMTSYGPFKGKYKLIEENGLNFLMGESGSGKTYKVLEEVKRINENNILRDKAKYFTADKFSDKILKSYKYDFRDEFLYYFKHYYDFIFIDNVEYFLNKNHTRKELICLSHALQEKDNLILIVTWELSKKEEFFNKFYNLI